MGGRVVTCLMLASAFAAESTWTWIETCQVLVYHDVFTGMQPFLCPAFLHNRRSPQDNRATPRGSHCHGTPRRRLLQAAAVTIGHPSLTVSASSSLVSPMLKPSCLRRRSTGFWICGPRRY